MSRRAPSPRDRLHDRLSTAVCVGLGCLVALTWLTPTEGAIQGDTVPRALAWLLFASAWLFLCIVPAPSTSEGVPDSSGKEGTASLALRAVSTSRWLDLGVALFIGGHVLSGLIVLLTGGQQRHAANLLVEWLGLGAAWIVLRDAMAIPAWRSALTATLLALATAAAGLGIWQHQVSLPALAREVGPKITAAREALARGESHPFLNDLAAAGVPTTEPGLTLYEKRLRDSREPFAMFALANTLGGLLASAIVWAAGVLTEQRSPRNSRWWLGVACCVVMAACLVLTKSRTASLAALIGFCLIGWHGWQQFGGSRRRLVLGLAVGLAVTVVIAGGAFAVGVWDREVLVEAPKSLGYRWLYWQGTGRLIAEHPVAGVGLGQFRPAYLRVKLPAASEEIADPHNFILETWVNGGLLAVCGLIVIGLGVLRAGWTTSVRGNESSSPTRSHSQPDRPRRLSAPDEEVAAAESSNTRAAWGVIGGGGLAFVVMLLGGPWSDAVAALAIGWVGALAVWWPLSSFDRFAPLVALVALGIHGLGAGGGSLPAVLLWGLILLVMLPLPAAQRPSTGRRLMALATGAVAASAGLFLWWPDVQASRLMAAGDQAAQQVRWDDAHRFYAQAMAADVWNPDPAGRSAEVRLQQIDADTSLANEFRTRLLDECLTHYLEAGRRDPANGQWDHAAGLALQRFDRPPAAAMKLFERACRKSPTNASWQADWAAAAHAAGRDGIAREAADRALQQDDLNRQLGHSERWLSEARRRELQTWRSPPPGSPATE